MPFTPSHAVVALPFVRTPLVPAAIAVGAMAPDLPLFLRIHPMAYSATHDLAWLPMTTVLALALLLLWRCALRPGARELSPAWLAARLPDGWDDGAAESARQTLGMVPPGEIGAESRRSLSWRRMLLLGASLGIGVVSHVVWDLFTHEGRAGVAALPLLAQPWGPLLGYKWLQHGSSAIGLAILAAWSVVWLTRRPPVGAVSRVLPDGVRAGWWASLPLALLVAWACGLAVLGPLDREFTAQHLAYRVLPPACAAWGVLTLLLCVVVQRRRASPRVGASD
jgi:hypothetical protein